MMLEFEELLNKGIEQFTISIHGGLSPKKQINIIEKNNDGKSSAFNFGNSSLLSIKEMI